MLTLLAVVVGWVVALPLGLFVTGAAGASLRWLVLGTLAVQTVCGWCALQRR